MRHMLTPTTLAIALLLTACSQPATSTSDSEVAPIPSQSADIDPAAGVVEVNPQATAFLAALSPQEVVMAQLSCIPALDSAKANPALFDNKVAAQLAATPSLLKDEVLKGTDLKPELIDMAIASSPTFSANGPAPTAEQLSGINQCLQLATIYHAQKASN